MRQLSMEVLLIAADVGLERDLLDGGNAIIGEVIGVAVVLEQLSLAFISFEILANDDQSIQSLASVRLVLHLGNFFRDQSQVPKVTLLDNRFLDRFPLGPRLRSHCVASRPLEKLPMLFCQ